MINMSRALKVTVAKCHHIPKPIRRVGNVRLDQIVVDHFKQEHGEIDGCENPKFRAWTDSSGVKYDLEHNLSFDEIESLFDGFNNVNYQCDEITEKHDNYDFMDIDDPPIPKRNVFEEMMQNREKINLRVFPKPKSVLNRKDELFNMVVEIFKLRKVDFPVKPPKKKEQKNMNEIETNEGNYCVNVITNALWYITNDHDTINNAHKHSPATMFKIPNVFENSDGFNETKRKKQKMEPLRREDLHSHAEAVYSLLLRPCASTKQWEVLKTEVKQLGDCLHAYAEHLRVKAEEVAKTRSQLKPARTVCEDMTVRHVTSTQCMDVMYRLIDDAVKKSGLKEPVLFDEEIHLVSPFEDNVQRFRFFEQIKISVPIDLFRFCPGGSCHTISYIVQVEEKRTQSEMLTDSATMSARLKPFLREYHTRAQKRDFKKRVSNVANIQKSLLDVIYKELSLDASVTSHPDTAARIYAMFLGEEGLVADLRSLNPGRPGGTFDVFFKHMEEFLECNTAPDDRRHGTSAQMSQWLSLKDLINQVTEKCPPNTPIPSKSLVRLQFTPTNPYTRTALRFTSRFPLQHKIQRRQLRAKHPDDHFCAAQYKYMKQRAIEEGDNAVLFCCDDKSKIHVGEPDAPVSTGVRGKTSITTTDTTLEALDHDMYKSSLTPNVVLQCDVPPSADKSFVRGQVHFTVSDSVFQSSSPFRHGVMLAKICKEFERIPSVLMKFTDGGTDQRNTLESVKVATICLFKELGVDMIIAGRCAPGHSYTNPAERIMSILNIGIQNSATERERGSDDFENNIKSKKSMKTIRELKVSGMDVEENWAKSVKPVQEMISSRFERLTLKDVPFHSVPVVTNEEIRNFQKHISKLFPGMDVNKLQKQHTQKNAFYEEWKRKHCRETHYTFQVRKCGDINCCPAPSRPIEKLKWLPSPVLQDDKLHYKSYDVVKEGQVTSDSDRPSLSAKQKTDATKSATKKKGESSKQPDQQEHQSKIDSCPMSAQTARAIVTCVECRKPRVVYCPTKLDYRHKIMLARNVSSFEYSCGSFLFPPSEKRKLAKAMVVRPNLTCGVQIEIPYYGDNGDLGRKDICSHCAGIDAEINSELKKKYKTVLPICENCIKDEKTSFVARPYKQQKLV